MIQIRHDRDEAVTIGTPGVVAASQSSTVSPVASPPQAAPAPAEEMIGAAEVRKDAAAGVAVEMQRERKIRKPRKFMFATGIECSYPIVGNGHRIDQMQSCGHYEMWEKDLELVHQMGIGFLRYGPPYYKMHLAPGKYDWAFFDKVAARMQELGIEPVIDLVHFGVPDWIGNFQNGDFPKYLAEYALAFAQRYPHIRYYTPVNEIYITAQFSGAFGWWNEQQRSDRAFVTALTNCCKATLMAQQAILSVRPDAIFIHSESTEYVHPGSPMMVKTARFLNERRFLSLDLIYNHAPCVDMYRYLMSNGMSEAEHDWFMSVDMRRYSIMGTDYYVTNEHIIQPDGTSIGAGDVYGYYVIAKQYYDRYKMPVMHTETNRIDAHSIEWLLKQWVNLLRLREDGVPVIGFTWYALTDQMDWDSALTRPRGHVNTLGLYDLKRHPRAVAKEYKRIIEEYGDLPLSGSELPILTA
ncbi:MAG TPA: family 1 glycosylhydrolase [Planctomycetota bacterium]|nr:family 1 glycosylhydrolase [Planctomycetota bacterium]